MRDIDRHSIVFNRPEVGPRVISPSLALPTIVGQVDLDGYTQPGASANTLVTGTNAVLRVVIGGSAAGATDALQFAEQGGRPWGPYLSTVRGLVIRNFS
ncbi:MAG TPA: hypothetical protein VNE58_18530 [Casimicrobiaceae bacterium]|nr:hypothetical protein [Casimicrobiaceae bacterium]